MLYVGTPCLSRVTKHFPVSFPLKTETYSAFTFQSDNLLSASFPSSSSPKADST